MRDGQEPVAAVGCHPPNEQAMQMSYQDRLPGGITHTSCKPQQLGFLSIFLERDGPSLILPASYQWIFLPALYLCSLPQSCCTTIDYPKPHVSLSEGAAGSAAHKFIAALLQVIFLHCFFMPLHPFLTYVLPHPKFLFQIQVFIPNTYQSSLLVISVLTQPVTSSPSFSHPISA